MFGESATHFGFKERVAKTRPDLTSPYVLIYSVRTKPCHVLYGVGFITMLCTSQCISTDTFNRIAQHGNQSEIDFMLKLDRPIPKAAGSFVSEYL